MIDRRRWRGVATLLLLGAASCTPPGRAAQADSTLLNNRAAEFAARLARAGDDPAKPVRLARWELPHALREISGLALTPDGRLLAHDDNLARIFEVDYRRGVVAKEFTMGEALVQGDFEAIAVAFGQVFLLASDGTLYRFEEADDGRHSSYEQVDTGLGKKCEFEGMAFEPASQALLLACKTVYEKELDKNLVIFRWPLPRGEPLGVIAVSESEIEAAGGLKKVTPTDLQVDPATGNLLVLLRESAVVEIGAGGGLVSVRALPQAFEQPEGLAITPEGWVIVSDEAGQRPASITLYRRLPPPVGGGREGRP